jgi:hypothetical protein
VAGCSKDLNIALSAAANLVTPDAHTTHTAWAGGLLSDGGSQVAGRRSSGIVMAAPGDRLWLAVSKSMEKG